MSTESIPQDQPTEAPSERPECPFANVGASIRDLDGSKCPFHAHTPSPPPKVTSSIDLIVQRTTFLGSTDTAALLRAIGGGDKIRECCTRFYARAFLDKQLQPFFFEEDGATRHGQRLADWIIEKMGGEGTPWTDSGRYGMRQPSHYKAWNSKKRDVAVRGDHFNLVDTRTWMRLHFWAARECELHNHKAFWAWYIRFLQHFVAIYERRAVPFAFHDANWAANTANIDAYLENDHKMIDLEN
ncbi:hypothetical protein Ae201684P_002806 [Aphanomyces euteiches]|nr:hypothetical protein Ae201684P_002806 [Aphanomyces euteiches]KAH9156866.1 hypothetical protein AeRB84_001262 [Aphanomyces euteiches]